MRESNNTFLLHPVRRKVALQKQVVLQKGPPARPSTQTERQYRISPPNSQRNNAACCDKNIPQRAGKTICYWRPKLILNIDVWAPSHHSNARAMPQIWPRSRADMGPFVSAVPRDLALSNYCTRNTRKTNLQISVLLLNIKLQKKTIIHVGSIGNCRPLPDRGERLPISAVSRPALGSTQPPDVWVLGGLFPQG